MKVTITHLKAPWPEGSKVGDVVEFDGEAPAWAVGKSAPAEADAPVTASYPKAAPQPEPGDAGALQTQLSDALAGLDALKAAHADEVKALRAELDAGGAALQAQLTENENLTARVNVLQEQLDSAQAKLAIPAVASILAAEQQAAEERAAMAAAPATGRKKAG
jgi:hypothetical protein